ncbi:T9SS type A sorting domain-containing protein [Rufibacter sp. LB8]|uniref:T9SS type A sorting domain-containing protein n=1 Tax=Rufibacter sp. LB8 TaxID=2777781 RepID=UPI00178C4C2D|nr:T9SS type A sorting domain-containing protein [Rufibacter sp. LB8]
MFCLSCLLGILFSSHTAVATHLKAGNIYYKSDTTANPNPQRVFFKLVTYSLLGGFEDPTATLFFGDCTSATSARSSKIIVENGLQDTYANVYYFEHTYSAPGVFRVTNISENRTGGIVNIQNSVQLEFLIQSTVTIDPFLGANSSPVFQNPPAYMGARNQPFYYHPLGFDADGDSLSFKVIPPKSVGTSTACQIEPQNAPGYQPPGIFLGTPSATVATGFSMDQATGFVVWNTPGQMGIYTLAFEVEEWRNGRLIGKVTRDMDIRVIDNTFSAISLAGEDQTTCPGTPVQIGAAPETGYTYEWVPKTGLSNAFIANPTVSPTRTENYILLVKHASNGGINSMDAVKVTVQPAPTNVTISQAAATTLRASGTGLTYEWRKDGEVLTGQTGAQLNVSASGAYAVRARQGSGCYSLWSAPFTYTILSSVPERLRQQFNLYPNPAAGQVTLSVPTQARLFRVQAINSQGRSVLLHSQPQANATYTLAVQHLPTGIYLLQVHTDKGSWTQRLVVNR